MASSRPPRRRGNQIIRRVGSTLVAVQNKLTPTDDEWEEFLRLLANNLTELPKLRLIVVTAGGAPDTTQRKRLEATLKGTPMRVAVVSDNIKIRFVASTIALFHSDHKSFTTTEFEDAFEHLGLHTVERRLVEASIREMSAMLV